MIIIYKNIFEESVSGQTIRLSPDITPQFEPLSNLPILPHLILFLDEWG